MSFINTLETYLNANLHVIIEGPVGCGKTAIIKQWCKDNDRKYYPWIASRKDAVDIKGMPQVKDGITKWCFPKDEWPQEGERGCIHFDELDRGITSVHNGILSLCDVNGKIEEYTLPSDCVIICCINGAHDTGTKLMSKAVMNRFAHIDTQPNNKDVANYLSAKGYDERLISFIDRTHDLFTEEVLRGQKAFPTPRTLEMVGKILPYSTPDTLLDLCTGIIGQSAAFALETYFQLAGMLPDISDILANPKTADLPNSLDAEYFVTGVLTLAVKNDVTAFKAIATYAERLSKECEIVTMLRIISNNKMLTETKTFTNWQLTNESIYNV